MTEFENTKPKTKQTLTQPVNPASAHGLPEDTQATKQNRKVSSYSSDVNKHMNGSESTYCKNRTIRVKAIMIGPNDGPPNATQTKSLENEATP